MLFRVRTPAYIYNIGNYPFYVIRCFAILHLYFTNVHRGPCLSLFVLPTFKYAPTAYSNYVVFRTGALQCPPFLKAKYRAHFGVLKVGGMIPNSIFIYII